MHWQQGLFSCFSLTACIPLIRIWRRSIAREVHLRVKHASQSHACRLMLSMGGLCFPAKDHRKPRDACTTFDT